MKRKIIGHRGAAGLAPENSLASLQAALEYGVSAVEFDVRLTADSQVVLKHKEVFLPQRRLGTLKQIRHTRHDRDIVTLDEALRALGSHPVIIDIKDHHMSDKIAAIVQAHPKANISLASFLHEELTALHQLLPDVPIYVLDHFSPLDSIAHARRLHANGIGLNKWLMNPLTYRLAERQQLDIFVYTINSPLVARFFHWLYPHVSICTDHPERFVPRRRRRTAPKRLRARSSPLKRSQSTK